ncbi:S24 family peptidase [Vibrio owensii]|uniref:S24 family peptidase n=1 Tax=Vibrio owensii TaxID=696485 RepID=UPI0013CEE1BC|nr:S24 family peptidase [Vibrio owensii]
MSSESLKTLSSLHDELERADTIQGRLQLLVQQAGNPNAFAKQTGLSVSGLKRYLSGGEPTASKIIQIAEKTGINAGWLLTGKGLIFGETGDQTKTANLRQLAILRDSPEQLAALDDAAKKKVEPLLAAYGQVKKTFATLSIESQEVLATSLSWSVSEFGSEAFSKTIEELSKANCFDDEFAMIPGYSVQVSAGHGCISGKNSSPTRHLAFRRKWLKWKGFSEKDLTVVWAKGDSMHPTISDNDTLVVHLGRKEPKDGYIYVFRNGDELFVKRYQSILGSWRLISDNSLYSPIDIPKHEQHQFEVIGQVVHVAKDIAD